MDKTPFIIEKVPFTVKIEDILSLDEEISKIITEIHKTFKYCPEDPCLAMKEINVTDKFDNIFLLGVTSNNDDKKILLQIIFALKHLCKTGLKNFFNEFAVNETLVKFISFGLVNKLPLGMSFLMNYLFSFVNFPYYGLYNNFKSKRILKFLNLMCTSKNVVLSDVDCIFPQISTDKIKTFKLKCCHGKTNCHDLHYQSVEEFIYYEGKRKAKNIEYFPHIYDTKMTTFCKTDITENSIGESKLDQAEERKCQSFFWLDQELLDFIYLDYVYEDLKTFQTEILDLFDYFEVESKDDYLKKRLGKDFSCRFNKLWQVRKFNNRIIIDDCQVVKPILKNYGNWENQCDNTLKKMVGFIQTPKHQVSNLQGLTNYFNQFYSPKIDIEKLRLENLRKHENWKKASTKPVFYNCPRSIRQARRVAYLRKSKRY